MVSTTTKTQTVSPAHLEPDASVVQIPAGLFGFESLREFTLVGNVEEAPFLWLERPDNSQVAFLVIPLDQAVSDYHPELSAYDVLSLKLSHPHEALVLGIVTLRGNGSATVNLKGPLVINARTRVGKQVVPLNAAEFSVQHPLPVAT